jgi:hypothetical protein
MAALPRQLSTCSSPVVCARRAVACKTRWRAPARCDAVQEIGGIDVVLAAVRPHADVVAVQTYGCGVLMNISENAPRHHNYMAQAGCIPAVVTAMRTHPAVAALQEYGCECLRTLACSVGRRDAIAAANGIRVIVAAMQRHANAVAVLINGCGALERLCGMEPVRPVLIGVLHAVLGGERPRDERIVAVADAGAVAVIIAAMQRHSASQPLSSAAVLALYRLAEHHHARAMIVDAGGVALLQQASRLHLRCLEVQHFVPETLARLR